MKQGLLIIFLISTLRLNATHIVGGEIELIHIDSSRYQLNLIQYFDDVNGIPDAEDQSITLYIFRKSDNMIMKSVLLFNEGSTFVPYTNIECTIDELITRRILYSSSVTLDPQLYDDPQGYYIIWERCCRNEVITNIRNPGTVGQAFYLEFPPLLKNGASFYNSSPVLFPPLSDYACINNFYYVDFAGMDPDGDSLVYSIAQPLSGFSSPAPDNIIPPPRPAPYPVVQWIPGITTKNSVPGSPPLAISRDGLLTVVPSESGLFVFSVLCEEYRDHVKIGEVRRDYQMLVIDCPDPGARPKLSVKTPGSDLFTDAPDTLRFTSEEEKCYEFVVKDSDGAENLEFRISPVNFRADLNESLSILSAGFDGPGDSVIFEFCFPECPFLTGKPQIVDIIAADDACPLPLLDTIRLVVYIDPPANSLPRFDTLVHSMEYNVLEGGNIQFNLKGSDPDGDSLLFSVISPVDRDKFDFDFDPVFPSPDRMELGFYWEGDCEKYDFSEQQEFEFLLLLEDKDFCRIFHPDTLHLDIHVELPPNSPPVISSDAITQPAELQILDSLIFNIHAMDPDADRIHVFAAPDGFDLSDKGFTPFEHTATGSLSAPFGWILECNTIDLAEGNEFTVQFIVEDDDKCRIDNADTLNLDFKALLPENDTPFIELSNVNSPDIEITAGDSLYIIIEGTDIDADSIYVSLSDPSGSLDAAGAVFFPVQGVAEISTSFFWKTDCSHLLPGSDPTLYDFQLIIRDNKCLVPLADTLDLTISLNNRQVNYEDVFIPNIFTPNSDGFNEYFTVLDLPLDNCDNRFQSIAIYNRDGKEVFFTKEREFRWYAQNVKNGVYYYHIRYSEREYKGYLHVLY
ncbi:MAG: gliding motility-associated C-terminal domain-containing protein [Cyclobacteriaceae bacterium]|nr:gliding motility-associated C-terminal domain-containing protein [Cyclobacteriaceae bacterium]